MLQGMFAQSFAQIFEELTAYDRTNIKSNLRPKIEYTLRPSNYDAKPWFLHFTALKFKFPRRF